MPRLQDFQSQNQGKHSTGLVGVTLGNTSTLSSSSGSGSAQHSASECPADFSKRKLAKTMKGSEIRRLGKQKQQQRIHMLQSVVETLQTQCGLLQGEVQTLQTQCGLLTDLLGDRVDQLQCSHLRSAPDHVSPVLFDLFAADGSEGDSDSVASHASPVLIDAVVQTDFDDAAFTNHASPVLFDAD
eukprot:1897120-Karenia_brevis.AAC.1